MQQTSKNEKLQNEQIVKFHNRHNQKEKYKSFFVLGTKTPPRMLKGEPKCSTLEGQF